MNPSPSDLPNRLGQGNAATSTADQRAATDGMLSPFVSENEPAPEPAGAQAVCGVEDRIQ